MTHNASESISQSSDMAAQQRSTLRSLMLSLLGSGLVGGILTASTLVYDGAGWAARVATALAMPLGLLWLGFLAAGIWFWLRNQQGASYLLILLWLLVGLAFNDRIAASYMKWIEHPGVDLSQPDIFPLKAVIVLGGGAGTNVYQVDELHHDGERVFSAAQLWHAGKCKWVICSDAKYFNRKAKANVPHTLLASVGVPDEVIIELTAENTKGEMKAIRELLDSPPEGLKNTPGKLGLITSAFHMRRAMRLASGQSIDFVPLPVAYRSPVARPFSPRDLVPTAGAGATFSMAFKEQLARFVGR